MATLHITDPRIIAYFEDLARAGFLSKAVWAAIGEALLQSTDKRFDTETAPDGKHWAQLSPRYAEYKRRIHGSDKILRMRGELRNTLTFQATDTSVAVGSPRIYSGLHQFGGRFKAFGKHAAAMPARPFLGLSAEDEQIIIDTVADAFDAFKP